MHGERLGAMCSTGSWPRSASSDCLVDVATASRILRPQGRPGPPTWARPFGSGSYDYVEAVVYQNSGAQPMASAELSRRVEKV